MDLRRAGAGPGARFPQHQPVLGRTGKEAGSVLPSQLPCGARHSYTAIKDASSPRRKDKGLLSREMKNTTASALRVKSRKNDTGTGGKGGEKESRKMKMPLCLEGLINFSS